jgi:hypothetical protein
MELIGMRIFPEVAIYVRTLLPTSMDTGRQGHHMSHRTMSATPSAAATLSHQSE